MIPPRRRPEVVTLLALSCFWNGIIGGGFLLISSVNGDARELFSLFTGHLPAALTVHLAKLILVVVGLLLPALYLRLGVGLWRLEDWARRTYPWLTGTLFLAVALSFGWSLRKFPEASALLVAIAVPFPWLVWYLRRPNIRFAFGWRPDVSTQPPIGGPPPKLSKAKYILPIAASIACIAGCIWIFASSIVKAERSSEIFKLTIASAEASSCVASRIGLPVTHTWDTSGSWEEGSTTGKADLDIPIQGPHGKGQLHVVAAKRNGVWSIGTLSLIQAEQEVQLLPVAENKCPTAGNQ